MQQQEVIACALRDYLSHYNAAGCVESLETFKKKTGRVAMTMQSAVVAFVGFIEQNGRAPCSSEYVAKNGLPHWTTIGRHFSSISVFRAIASSVLSSPHVSTSAIVAQFFRPCMRCKRLMLRSEQSNVRHCDTCRTLLFDLEEESMPWEASTMRIDFGDLEDLIDWSTM